MRCRKQPLRLPIFDRTKAGSSATIDEPPCQAGRMTTIFFQQQASFPKIIQFLRTLVFFAIITYAGVFDLASSGAISFFPDFLLLSANPSWLWLFQLLTSAIIIPYPGFGLSMVFDLLPINFFLSPIFTFVLSFLSARHFITLLLSLIAIGAGSFAALGSLTNAYAPPCSLFGGLALAIIIFWTLLHRKGQSTLLLAFPISRGWVLFSSACAAFYSPVSGGEWAHVGAIVCMAIASYLWGISRWRLRSHVDALEGFEEWLDSSYRTLSRLIQWYVARPFRKWFYTQTR